MLKVLVCVGINGEEFQNDASILDQEASAVSLTPEPSTVDKVSARRGKNVEKPNSIVCKNASDVLSHLWWLYVFLICPFQRAKIKN